jgi:hypothetical protein
MRLFPERWVSNPKEILMTEVDWNRLAGRIRGLVVPRSDADYVIIATS